MKPKKNGHGASLGSEAISSTEHVALLAAEHTASLAHARLAHANTRKQMQTVIAELAALKAKEAARQAIDAMSGDVKTAIADADAAMRALSDLTLSIRQTHNLSEHHAIDSATGAIISPGAQK